MKYRLALDVGTASCGLVVWTLDEYGQPSKFSYDSLDIWSEPLLPAKSGGVGEPKKAARRAARMMRRGHCRRARRLRRIAHLAVLLGLDKNKIPPSDGHHIHRLRAEAVEKRIELHELLHVLLRLAKNRGPSGDWVYAEPELKSDKGKGRSKKKDLAEISDDTAIPEDKEQKAAVEMGKIVGGVRRLTDLMREAAPSIGTSDPTLGQYLYYRLTREKPESVILGKPEIGLYPSRRLVETEFHRIWDKQAEFHHVLRDENIRRQFFDAIFYQRPLKSPAPMVGRCPLEPTLPRAPAAQVAAQAFRIEKQIADLRWGSGPRALLLSQEQKAVIRALLDTKAEVAFTSILDALSEAGYPGPQGQGLNMDRSSRESLKGNTTLAAIRSLKLEDEWNALDEKTRVQVINFLADLGSPDALDNDQWHQNFQTSQIDPATHRLKIRQFSPELIEFINFMRKHPKFGRLSAMGFDGKRMGYSIKALNKLTVLMQEGWDERAATDQAYPDHNKPKALSLELPLPEETGNTVVDVAMRQVYRAVRRAMAAMGGPPAEVIVELSREMALGLKQRGEIETKINVNNKARRDAAKAIAEHGEQATDKKIDRYLLWDGQRHYCPYCANRIELGEALGSETEREHILPRSLTRVGGKRSQLVLAHKSCNNEKGDRTPWLAFGHDATRWRIIEERAAQLGKNKQWGKAKLLLLKDWEAEVLDDASISDFTDRQFHESSWIAKLTAQWLRSVCTNVAVSRGELTAHLRRIWKLDTVIPQVRYEQKLPVLDREGKQISFEEFERHRSWWEGHDKSAGGVPTERKPDKRIDHRHHLVDALVISLTDRKLFKKMADNYKLESERARRGERARLTRYVEPPITVLRELAMEIVTNAEVRHKQDHHLEGQLFKETAHTKVCVDDESIIELRKTLAAGLSADADLKEVKKALRTVKDTALRTRLLESVKSGISERLSAVEALARPEEQLAAREVLADWATDKDLTLDKAHKRIENIVSKDVRQQLSEAFEKRIEDGKTPQQAFAEPIEHKQYATTIKRVLVLARNRGFPVFHESRAGRHYKYYVSADYAYMDVCMTDSELEPRLVPRAEAARYSGRKLPGWERFFKNDTVRYADGKELYIIRKFDNKNKKLICIRDTETAPNIDYVKVADGRRDFSGDGLRKLTVISRV